MTFPSIGLETAARLSVETDARAPDGEAPGSDPAGWWGDAFDDTGAGPIGSRLWLVRSKGKVGTRAAAEAEQALSESLSWLVRLGELRALRVMSSTTEGRLDLFATAQRVNGAPFELSPGA